MDIEEKDIESESDLGSLVIQDLGLFRHLTKSNDVHDFKDRLTEQFARIGITDFTHHYLDIAGVSRCVLDSFGTYPDQLLDRFVEEGFPFYDLAMSHVRTSDAGVFQSEIEGWVNSSPVQDDFVLCNREILKFQRSYKIIDSYNLPIIKPGYRAGVALSSPGVDPEKFREIIANNYYEILKLADYMDTIGRKKFKTHFHSFKTNPKTSIGKAPLRLLATLRKDLRLNEAAQVLGVSVSTANKQLAAARSFFGTATTHGTIDAAVKEGLLDPVADSIK